MSSEFSSTPSVDDGHVEAFYTKVEERHKDIVRPWQHLTDQERAFFRDLMVTVVDDDFPVFYTWNRQPDWMTGAGLPQDVDVPLPEVEATPEYDVKIAKDVLRWETVSEGVLMYRGTSKQPLLLKVPEQWGPTRSIGQARHLLDWLKEHGWQLDLFDARCNPRLYDNGWWFELGRYEGASLNPPWNEKSNDPDSQIPTHYYTLDDGAPTLELAICRAVLAAAQWMDEHPEDFPDWADRHPHKFSGA